MMRCTVEAAATDKSRGDESMPVCCNASMVSLAKAALSRTSLFRQSQSLQERICPHWPGTTPHSLTVMSSLADASRFPSGLNATHLTKKVCPFNVSVS